MQIIADFIRESVPTTGTGSVIDLGGAVDDSRTFASVMADGDTCDYYIEDPGVGREAGTATYDATNNQLTVSVRSSTNAGSRINLSGNAKIGIGIPGDKSAARNALDVLAEATASSGPVLAFDTWRTPNANRPVLVTIGALARTDGTTFGRVQAAVDESGGTSADYTLDIAWAEDKIGADADGRGTVSFYVPAGGSYQIVNDSDPQNTNNLEVNREFTL